jgi:hypothetical protein
MDPICATPSARHLGDQFAPVLEKVQMPPAALDSVVHATPSFALRTLKMLPWHVLQSQFQALWFSLKAALRYPPLLRESQRCSKEFFQCHPFLLLQSTIT